MLHFKNLSEKDVQEFSTIDLLLEIDVYERIGNPNSRYENDIIFMKRELMTRYPFNVMECKKVKEVKKK